MTHTDTQHTDGHSCRGLPFRDGLIKYRKWVKNQIAVNDKMKEEGADPELKKTMKKLEEDFKIKSNNLETSEKARK